MLEYKSVFSGFSVNDAAKARDFYANVLGLEVTGGTEEEGMGMLNIGIGAGHVLLYQKENHQPASFTVLNFDVADIDSAVGALAEKGVEMIRYDGFYQDELGVSRGLKNGQGPDIAWFTDPAGNILAVLQQTPSNER